MKWESDHRGGCCAVVDSDRASSPGLGPSYPGVELFWQRPNARTRAACDRAAAELQSGTPPELVWPKYRVARLAVLKARSREAHDRVYNALRGIGERVLEGVLPLPETIAWVENAKREAAEAHDAMMATYDAPRLAREARRGGSR
jgi:hypothetical protein